MSAVLSPQPMPGPAGASAFERFKACSAGGGAVVGRVTGRFSMRMERARWIVLYTEPLWLSASRGREGGSPTVMVYVVATLGMSGNGG